MQVYVGLPLKDRPQKELKAFKKIYLDPGAEKSIDINIKKKDLRYYDLSISNWELAKGEYSIYVGNSSRNVDYCTKIDLN